MAEFPTRNALLTICLLLTATSYGQDIESLRREFERYKERQEKSMADYRAAQERSMDSLRESANRAFAQMLKKEWEWRDAFRKGNAYEKPKPDNPPVKPGTDVPRQEPQPNRTVEPRVEPNKKDEPAPERASLRGLVEKDFGTKYRIREHSFYQQPLFLADLSSQWPTAARPLNQQGIASYFNACTGKYNEELGNLLDYHRIAYKFNDWAFQDMVSKWAEMNFRDRNDQVLFTWFILLQQQYDVRLFYSDEGVVLGYAMDRILYGISYIEMEGRQYRLLKPGPSRYYTYPQQNKYAKKVFNPDKITLVNLQGDRQTRELKFSHRGKPYRFSLSFDRSRQELYESMPLTDFELYVIEPGHQVFRNTVERELKPIVDGFTTPAEKVSFIQSLVTYSFPYKTDQDQFGYEKFCLPEEMLAYPFADCEDRSFLMSYLVRTLTGLRTIAVQYPGHMALGVEIPGATASMAKISHQNRTYVYCDPTYFGADVGMMPEQYRGLFPVVHGGKE